MLLKTEDRRNRLKLLSCMFKGPGPAYKLPSLIGHEGHDPSRRRNPAYSMRHRTEMKIQSVGPGPRYNVSKLTNHGPDRSPAYRIIGRDVWKLPSLGPGPGAYSPESCPPMNHNRRSPAYSIKSKSESKYTDDGPGPNAYLLPSCIGPKIPDKPAQGAFSMTGHHEFRIDDVGPGPAAYRNVNNDLIKRRYPAYSLRWRHRLSDDYTGPGPRYYPKYDCGKRPPMYSFGVRHSECAGTPITTLDEE